MTEGKLKVVVTRRLMEDAQRLLEAEKGLEIVQWDSDEPADPLWLSKNLPGASGVLTLLNDPLSLSLLESALPHLKAISTYSVGLDHLPLPFLTQHGIRLGYTPTALTTAVADIVIMLTLMAQRRAAEAFLKVKRGEWASMAWFPGLMVGPGLEGKTVGFLGFGRIAQCAVQRFLGFGVGKVVYLTSKPGQSASEDFYGTLAQEEEKKKGGKGGIEIRPAKDWRELARESDVLVIACALTDATRQLVGVDFLAGMKRTAVLVNIARGPIVDTDALLKALSEETLFGAGLDVLEGEPNIAADHPLLQQERCVLLPHIGSASTEARAQMGAEAVKNLIAGLRGEVMINEVKRE